MQHTVKATLDEIFKKVHFNKNLYKKLVYSNIEFITKTQDHKNLFGSRLIGCHYLKYNQSDKSVFYDSVFDLDYEVVSREIQKITTIPQNFKIARDDINLVCFYVAHKFLSNKELKEEDQIEFACEALNYFNYRTLVLICATYFIYPISEEKALSLVERLSNKYLIKKLKNWNEYCQYRSKEYLSSKYKDILLDFTQDQEIPNAITDLYNRTKDTIKNIYSEFIDMVQKEDYIKSKKSVVNDIEGEEVILDTTGTTKTYYNIVDTVLNDKQTFIRSSYIDVVTDIINSVSYKQMYQCLDNIFEYTSGNSKNYQEVVQFFHSVIDNTVEYLLKNKLMLTSGSNIINILNLIVGNLLYARGESVSVNEVKNEGEKLIKKVYKDQKEEINERYIKNLRNALYLYIVLYVLIAGKK